MTTSVETTNTLPTSDGASTSSSVSTVSTDKLDSSLLKDKVTQKIAAQEASRSTSGERTPLRERVANKLYVSTPSSGGSRFNVQSLRAALAAPILAVLGTAKPEEKPTTSSVSVPSSWSDNPTTACELGQNVFLTRSMPNVLPPTLFWNDASWGNWSTLEAKYIVHIIPGDQAVRAYGERPYRGKLPPTKRHFVPSPDAGYEEEDGTHVLRLVTQPQRHGGESALSVKQIAEALAFVWEAWEEAEELQRKLVDSSDVDKEQAKVELPSILFTTPAGMTTDASLAALAVAYKKTLSGGAGARKSAFTVCEEMLKDVEGVRGEWHDALGLLDYLDMDFLEEMWPKAEVTGEGGSA